jgi:1-acyl-sn-glycerol-3-phosphate acyltransferase
MSEADRPEDTEEAAESSASLGRVRVQRGTRGRAGRQRAAPSGEIGRRFTALERRVEKALARSGLGRGVAGRDLLGSALDGALATVASLRRWSLAETIAAMRRPAWSGVEELAERLAEVGLGTLSALYRYWWRVEMVGCERVPGSGRVLIVANRSSALVPYEALMLGVALASVHPARRSARALVDDWLLRLPVLGTALARAGAVRAGVANARRLLEREEAVIVFPEGEQALAKPFRDRYRLTRFPRTIARLAIETGTPIVPVAVIGAEEVHPVVARLDPPGRLFGLPTLPLTPTFPLLGLLGLLPLPTKWTLLVGEPLDVAARHAPAEASEPETVARLSDQVRERLQALVLEGLRRRQSIFLG